MDFLKSYATRSWLVLMLLTLTTMAVGEQGLAGPGAMSLVLLMTLFKVERIVHRFMGFSHVTGLMKVMMWLFVILLLATISGGYMITQG
ncbi:hypothetical protein [Magnetococcus sp. PR-3]|uniref:hypothetical protein n=1 Tax=Magnetococcus sp. PR-3 TaxID=3120355 RepID=UPI002FCE052C